MSSGKSSGNAGHGYAPLSYLDRLKIRAATRHLHSRYVSVRQAAHKEIERILRRRHQSRYARLNPKKLARQAWERVNFGKLHKCGNCGHGERDKAMFRKHVNSHMRQAADSRAPASTPGLRERQDHARTTARPQARAEDMRRQAGLLPQERKQAPPGSRPGPARTPGSVWNIGGPAADVPDRPRPARDRSAPGPVTNATLRQAAREARKGSASARADGRDRPPAPARAPSGPESRTAAAPPRQVRIPNPPLPHETVRAPSPSRGKPRLRMPRLRARA